LKIFQFEIFYEKISHLVYELFYHDAHFEDTFVFVFLLFNVLSPWIPPLYVTHVGYAFLDYL